MFKNNVEKIKYVIESINDGKDPESIAKDLGYKNYKSLDMFMRREGYIKERRSGNYYPKNGHGIILEEDSSSNTSIPLKVMQIIKLFKENKLNPKQIANEMGFESPREMAIYMKSKGYIWDSQRNNYISEKKIEIEDNKEEIDVDIFRTKEIEKESQIEAIENDFLKYIDIIKYLDSRKERLIEIIESSFEGEAGKLPRYVIKGLFITKSIHMSSKLDQMVRDFSEEKNVSQKDIFEVALIDFFKKYGYHKEIQTLLNSYD